jgi:hypothetical protein
MAEHRRPVELKDIFHYVHHATSVECAWVEQWLNNNPDIDLNAFQNEDGWTLLLELVANAPSPHAGHFRMARLLLSHGADINLCHPQICGLAPLHFAVKRMIAGPIDDPHLAGNPDDKKLAMVKFLLSNGADVNLKSRMQGTPLSMALSTAGNVGEAEERVPSVFLRREIVTSLLHAGASLDVCKTFSATDTSVEAALDFEERSHPEGSANDESFQTCKQLIADVRAAGSWRLYALRPHKDFLSLRTLAARGRAKPTGLLKSVCDLPDGVVFKCLEFKFGTAGVRVPSLEQLPVLSDPPDIMEAIHTLAATLQISNGEAIELIMREEANLPDYA